jgi:hypothetical protein
MWKMQNVEFFRKLTYPVEHHHVIGDRVADIAVETVSAFALVDNTDPSRDH